MLRFHNGWFVTTKLPNTDIMNVLVMNILKYFCMCLGTRSISYIKQFFCGCKHYNCGNKELARCRLAISF